MSRTSETPPAEPAGTDAEIAESADGFAEFVALLEPAAPSERLRERLLGELRTSGRHERHAERVAEMLDVALDAARAMLDRAGTASAYEPGPFEGVELLHVEGGPKARGAITGFVRIPAGRAFPRHAHLGAETVLVISGSILEPETGRVHRTGDLVRADEHQEHSVLARPGPDLVYLAVLFHGLRIGDTELRADDPRL